jgi:hypothetical protein
MVRPVRDSELARQLYDAAGGQCGVSLEDLATQEGLRHDASGPHDEVSRTATRPLLPAGRRNDYVSGGYGEFANRPKNAQLYTPCAESWPKKPYSLGENNSGP